MTECPESPNPDEVISNRISVMFNHSLKKHCLITVLLLTKSIQPIMKKWNEQD